MQMTFISHIWSPVYKYILLLKMSVLDKGILSGFELDYLQLWPELMHAKVICM